MITSSRQHDAGDEPEGLAEGLEQLARHLDAQHYPGRAWPAAPAPGGTGGLPARVRRRCWAQLNTGGQAARATRRFLAWAAAAAVISAGVVAAVLGYRAGNSQAPRPPMLVARQAIARAPQAAEHEDFGRRELPQVVLVEDADSYSFIDLTSGAPVVSFATKDSCSPACVVAVFEEPPAERGPAGGRNMGP